MVIGRHLAARPVLAERGHRGVDQPGIDLGQHVVAKAQRLERSRPVVLHQHVGGRDELFQHLPSRLGLQVQRDRSLVGSLGQEASAHQFVVQVVIGAGVSALVGLGGVFDLDHIGAEQAKLIGGERAGENVGDVEDANALERANPCCAHPGFLLCFPDGAGLSRERQHAWMGPTNRKEASCP